MGKAGMMHQTHNIINADRPKENNGMGAENHKFVGGIQSNSWIADGKDITQSNIEDILKSPIHSSKRTIDLDDVEKFKKAKNETSNINCGLKN